MFASFHPAWQRYIAVAGFAVQRDLADQLQQYIKQQPGRQAADYWYTTTLVNQSSKKTIGRLYNRITERERIMLTKHDRRSQRIIFQVGIYIRDTMQSCNIAQSQKSLIIARQAGTQACRTLIKLWIARASPTNQSTCVDSIGCLNSIRVNLTFFRKKYIISRNCQIEAGQKFKKISREGQIFPGGRIFISLPPKM